MTSSPEIRALAAKIARLDKRISGVASDQLKYSSLEDGGINEYDGSDQLVSRWGGQYDGTHGVATLAGPVPPTPAGLVAEPVPTGVRFAWGGEWVQAEVDRLSGRPTVAPLDFTMVEVHVSTDLNFSGLLFSTKRGEIVSARGGEVIVPVGPDVEVYARLVARTAAGKASLASEVVGPVSGGTVPAAAVDIDLSEIGGNQIFWGTDEPDTDKIGDLWLKKPDNVAYRYQGELEGWVVVRDQGVVQALQEAADAADAAQEAGEDALAAYVLGEQAQTAAGAAQTDADQALLDAAAAQSAANLAKSTADGKITAFRQSSAPSTTGRVNGDLWVDSDDGLLYVWTGAWTVSPDQRVAAVVSSNATKITVFAQDSAPSTTGRVTGDVWIETDAGNKQYVWNGSWTARLLGSTAISATARQLGAVTVFRQSAAPTGTFVVGDLWLDTDDGLLYSATTTAGAWTLNRDAGVQQAITAAGTAQTTANSKTMLFAQTSAPPTTGRTDGDIWLDTDDGNRQYTWASGAWTSRQIGSGAVAPNSLIAKDVVATGSVSAALLETILVLATTIIAGDPNGIHARMDSTGFRTFAPNPIAGQPPIEATRMGTQSADYIAVVGADGKVKGGIDLTGKVTGTAADFSGTVRIYGYKFEDHIFSRSQGALALGIGSTTARSTGNEIGLFDLLFTAEPGRNYTLNTTHIRYHSTQQPIHGAINIHYEMTTNGTVPAAPTINSPIFTRIYAGSPFGFSQSFPPIRKFWQTPTDGLTRKYRFLLSHVRVQGSGDLYLESTGGADEINMWVEDAGRLIPNTLTPNNGGGGSAGANPVQRYEIQFDSSWARSWRGNGSVFTDDAAWQGSIGDSNGNMYSCIGWGDLLFYLTGSTIETIQVYMYSEHWYNNSGGVARIGLHGHLNTPASVTLAQYGVVGEVGGWVRGGGQWVTLPSATYAGWRDGSFRGVILGPSPNAGDRTYYGRFTGGGASKIRIVYYK